MANGICKETTTCFVCNMLALKDKDDVTWAPTWGAGKKCHTECYPKAADVLAGRLTANPSNRPPKGSQAIPQEQPKEAKSIPQDVRSGTARFASICKVCGKQIEKDAAIKWAEGIAGSSRHADCFGKPDAFDAKGNPAQALPQETPKAQPQAQPQSSSAAGKALAELIANDLIPMLQDKLAPKVDEDALDKLVKEQIAKHSKRITVEITATGETKDYGMSHYQLPEVLAWFALNKHVYLYGAAGGGKSFVVEQVAKQEGAKFGMVSLNDMSSPLVVTGFETVAGNYKGTPFVDIYENGGYFLFDEVDAANGNFLTSLNTALSQRYMFLPDGRRVEMHEKCHIAAAGNTCGLGASENYNTRTQLDGAFRERFAFVEWSYDEKLERSIAHTKNGDAAAVDKWVDWVQKLRAHSVKAAPELMVTPRASIEGADALRHKGLSLEGIADAVIWKGLDKDTRKRILTAVPYPSLIRTIKQAA